MITQSDLAECNRTIAEEMPRYDFTALNRLEAWGWRESAAKWRQIASDTFYTDFARCCYAQRLAIMCETFAAEKERNELRASVDNKASGHQECARSGGAL